MLQSMLQASDGADVTLCYSARTARDVCYLPRLAALAEAHPGRFSYQLALAAPFGERALDQR